MVRWSKYPRSTINLADAASSAGFSAVKSSTQYTFSLTRRVVTTTIGVSCCVIDYTIFGGSPTARTALSGAAARLISLFERLTLAPIFLSEYITTTSLLAAHSSLNVLAVFFPTSDDAAFSLASFINIIRREFFRSAPPLHEPATPYGIAQIARGIVAWAALQGVTHEWQERRWLRHCREIRVNDPTPATTPRESYTLSRRASRVRVTSDVIFPGNSAQIIAADIGEAPPHRSSQPSSPASTYKRFSLSPFTPANPQPLSVPPSPTLAVPPIDALPTALRNHELKATLRRLSKIVLAGYGGAPLLFFGVSPSLLVPPPSRTSTSRWKFPFTRRTTAAVKAQEEAQLAHAISASEAEAAGEDNTDPDTIDDVAPEYSWWDVLLGRHDQEIFERAAGVGRSSEKAKEEIKARIGATAVIGAEHMMPRFWILTDHSRAQVVLVIRGTMSLNEIAADLTCQPEEFEPASTPDLDLEVDIPGRFTFPSNVGHPYSNNTRPRSSASSMTAPRYHVHGGMLKMARAMGDSGKPVQLAVREALYHNPDYELVLCGHSLGAGVAAILGMMWADPRTCLTVPQPGGLPPSRRVSVYCFAPPALTDVALSALAANLITSFVYSHDVVSRLSLGSMRDLKNAALWLCEAEQENGGEPGWGVVTTRARRWTNGEAADGDYDFNWVGAATSSTPSPTTAAGIFWRWCVCLLVWLLFPEVLWATFRDAVSSMFKRVFFLILFPLSLLVSLLSPSPSPHSSGQRKRKSRVSTGSAPANPPPPATNTTLFIAVRKTLEANMQMSNMFPPGRVLWAIRDRDLHPTHRSFVSGSSGSHHRQRSSSNAGGRSRAVSVTSRHDHAHGPQGHGQHHHDKVRLFEVLDVEKVFAQLVFARDMLSAHLPHEYDRVLHQLL